MMKKIFAFLVLLGTALLFGTAGASDVGKIEIGQACMQGIASVGFLFAGIFGLLLCRMDEIRLRRIRHAKQMRQRTIG